jgi:hypothetical protein
LAHLPMGSYAPNAARLAHAVIAFNLARAGGPPATPDRLTTAAPTVDPGPRRGIAGQTGGPHMPQARPSKTRPECHSK